MIAFENFTLAYGDNILIRDFNFKLKTKEKVVVTGCSGSGKSSLLHMMAGLQFGYKGKIFWDGCELDNMSYGKILSWRRQNLGFVFQHHHLLQDFTVLENVMMPAIINSHSIIDASFAAKDLLKSLGLSLYAQKPVNTLSGGEQQRVAIARAIVHKPKIIIADEPTGSLDPNTARTAIDLLFELSANASIVMVTHNMAMLDRFDRHFMIAEGVCLEA